MGLSRSNVAINMRRAVIAAAAAMLILAIWTTTPHATSQSEDNDGWTIPLTATEEKNPVTVTPQTLVAARALYQKNCRRCHGPKGVGDGPDADPDHMADMDLTNPKRAARNPDGVVFYKVWNGRTKPKMPAFKDELSREQVWAIVAYVQSLRKPATE